MPPVYQIFVQSEFSAAHCLRNYSGDCARVHGHNWTVEVQLKCRELDPIGLGIDFREVKGAIRQALSEIDHVDLNELPQFQSVNPSSENIARWLFHEIGRRLNSDRISISGVKVSESPQTGVLYTEE